MTAFLQGECSRRASGWSYTLFVRRNATRYAILLTSGGFSLAMLASLRLWIPFYVVLGFVAGCLTRDLAWARVIRRTWPFSFDVADWDKIQRLADEADAA